SPAGVKLITERSYRFFKRTIKNVVDYKEAIAEVVKDAKANGVKKIVLVGKSDVDFIVEHMCWKYGIEFGAAEKGMREEGADGIFYLYSEEYGRKEIFSENLNGNYKYLREILL
ncbi:MAG: hypothetical protein AB1798_18275, partial [Spirochaetota bacterium]